MNETIWKLKPLSDDATRLSSELGLPPEITQILINRQIYDAESAHKFLHGTLDDLNDPFLMKGMREAVDRIHRAASRKEKVLIFGDYDVDGVLSVVILTKALKSMGIEVDYYIPARLEEGYGIKEEHIEIVKRRGINLVISVDCGIKALEFVSKAKENGIDVIITDHHLPGTDLPDALAVLNPVLNDSEYPDKYLAGIGVVFKLIQSLYFGKKEASVLPHYLKLVSIGTIADVVNLRGENRTIVKFGLKGLENVSNIGLRSLMNSCGLSGKNVTVGDVGFRIGPRINAAGRLGMTDLAVQLFLSDDHQECKDLVKELNKLNSRRQGVEERIFNQAFSQIKENALNRRYKILILGCESWHRGVIGIVASKLKELFHRPVILFSYKDGQAYGSGRSISDFSLISCLNESREFLSNYGGHPLAVGCELHLENFGPFRDSVNSVAASLISDDDLKKKISIDTKIHFNDINSDFLEHLSLLSPFGIGNPRPVFLTENVEIMSEPITIKGKHSKLLVRNQGVAFEALGWGRKDWAESVQRGERIDLVYSYQETEYLGEQKLNLTIVDMRKN
jgi:single-stranded-DNA-specific exonuclease